MNLLWNQGQYETEAERATTWGGAEDAGARAGEHTDQTEGGRRPNGTDVISEECEEFNEWINRTCLCPKLETRIRQLSCEQANIKEQNQQLRSLNIQLQEQVESSREQLQAALGQLSLLQVNAAQEQVTRQRWVANSADEVWLKDCFFYNNAKGQSDYKVRECFDIKNRNTWRVIWSLFPVTVKLAAGCSEVFFFFFDQNQKKLTIANVALN